MLSVIYIFTTFGYRQVKQNSRPVINFIIKNPDRIIVKFVVDSQFLNLYDEHRD